MLATKEQCSSKASNKRVEEKKDELIHNMTLIVLVFSFYFEFQKTNNMLISTCCNLGVDVKSRGKILLSIL